MFIRMYELHRLEFLYFFLMLYYNVKTCMLQNIGYISLMDKVDFNKMLWATVILMNLK